MTEKNQKIDFLLEEFKALREEQLHNFRSVNQLHALQITASGAILGVAFAKVSTTPELLLLPILFSIPITYRLLNYALAIIRIGTYIEVFIEQQMVGLGWERRVDDFRNLTTASEKIGIFKNVKSAVSDYTIIISWIITALCLTLAFFFWKASLFILVVVGIISLIFLVPVSYRLSQLNKLREEFKKTWQEVLKKNIDKNGLTI